MAKWLLLDGFNLAFRSFYGIPELTRTDGFPTNAIHGWVRTIWTLIDREKPDHIIAFFDLGGSQERLKIMPEYKANRSETPDSLKQQLPKIKEVTNLLGIQIVQQEGVEADDLIACYAKKLAEDNHQVGIVSSDKDLAQILEADKIKQLLPPPTANPKLGWRVLDEEGVIKKFGVTKDKIVDYLSLIGDTSDNIMGIPGVGPKTAVKWITEYGSIEEIIKKANYIKPPRFQLIIPEYADTLRKNIQMIQLHQGYNVELKTDIHSKKDKLVAFFQEMEMNKTAIDTEKRYGT